MDFILILFLFTSINSFSLAAPNKPAVSQPATSTPPPNKSKKKKNYGIEKVTIISLHSVVAFVFTPPPFFYVQIERYFKEIKYEDIILGEPKIRLGQGATSKVLKATYLGQEVAIKKFHGNFDAILPKVRMEIALLRSTTPPHTSIRFLFCSNFY